uniref:3-oxoacyl-[acyl-carrier-protein] reductase n=1 Tax=Gossypium raimondii TaxID=29730 RepID=A0A0D2S6Y0_GOSRA|nr:hypothetical protein B456_006G272300 [Gossypium raimondii]
MKTWKLDDYVRVKMNEKSYCGCLPILQQEISFWGSVYNTYYAYGHLKKSKGKIIVIASSTGWLFAPRLSFYSASKAAVISFYETLRYEFGTEMADGKFISNLILKCVTKDINKMVVWQVEISVMPLESACECGKAIVEGGLPLIRVDQTVEGVLPWHHGSVDWLPINAL